MTTADFPPALSALACGDEESFTGHLCRVVGPHNLHDYDGLDDWATDPDDTKDA